MSRYSKKTIIGYDIKLLKEIKQLHLIIGIQKFELKWNTSTNRYTGNLEYETHGKDIFTAEVKLVLENNDQLNTVKGIIFLKKGNKVLFHSHFNQAAISKTFSIDFGKISFQPIIVKSGSGDIDSGFPNRNNGGYYYQINNEWVFESNDYLKEDQISNGKTIQIFYGTNRNKTGNQEPNEFYGDELSELSYGSCLISIPKNHQQGNIERPSKILWIWSLAEDTEKHIVLKKITEKTETDFHEWLKASLPQTDNKSGLLFVHGYNNSFAEAAWRTGQIAYDTPFNGLTGLFSWPSAGKELDYFADGEKANASIPQLEKFIEDYIIKTGVEKLHIIAHSMGNVVVTNALNNLAKKESFKPYVKTIDQIILAAPDLDQDVFNNNLLPTLKSIGNKRTLYASDKDKALKISEGFRMGRSRLGQGGEDIFVAEGLDSIDASNVMSEGNHHSYIFETTELLMDMNILFEDGWDPSKRRLERDSKNGFFYWLFRKDKRLL